MKNSKSKKQGLEIVYFFTLCALLPQGLAWAGREKEKFAEFHRVSGALTQHITQENPKTPVKDRQALAEAIYLEAQRLKIPDGYRIDGEKVDPVILLTSFIEIESSYRRTVVSETGARGYMQLLPSTVRHMDQSNGEVTPTDMLFDTRTNVRLGVTYLNYLMANNPDVRHTAMSYYIGPAAVKRGQTSERYWLKALAAYRDMKKKRLLEKGSPII